jgi:hypothetical protein
MRILRESSRPVQTQTQFPCFGGIRQLQLAAGRGHEPEREQRAAGEKPAPAPIAAAEAATHRRERERCEQRQSREHPGRIEAPRDGATGGEVGREMVEHVGEARGGPCATIGRNFVSICPRSG